MTLPNAGEGTTLTAEELEKDVELGDDELSGWGLEEESAKKIQTLHAQKAHFRKGREDAVKEAKEAKEALALATVELDKFKKPEKKEKDGDRVAKLERDIASTKLTIKHPTLDEEDIDLAFLLSEKKGKSASEVVESDFFQSYLKDKKGKADAAASVPGTSNRSGSGSGRYTIEDLQDPEKIDAMGTKEFKRLSDLAGSGSRFNVRT